MTPGGYKKKYEEEHAKMVEAYGEMRAIGETFNVPLMALSLTNDGEAASYVPIRLDEPSDEDEERGGVLPDEQIVSGNEDAGRGVATSSYCRFYRRIRPRGFMWANAECEWLSGILTDYNIGWLAGYAKRRASLLRDPEIHVVETHLYMGETWIYEGEIA